MYDIIFDFSSSPVGGGLRRLEAYAEYFSSSPIKVHFLIHAAASNREKIQQLVPTTLVHKTTLSKVMLNKNYLKKIVVGSKWLFSYGIPTKSAAAENNWLHISNVLPFYIFNTTVDPILFLKMFLLIQQYKFNYHNNDVISAESNFSINMYNKVTGWKGETKLLRNGLHRDDPGHEQKQPFAVAIGTHSYKRIDLTYGVFQALKDELGLEKLLIVGDSKRIPRVIRSAADVETNDFLAEGLLQSRLQSASYFISTSEVENSSCAVLEGLQYTQNAILSSIPSHQEMVRPDSGRHLNYMGKDYMIINESDIRDTAMAKWSMEIGTMLLRMGFN